MDKIILHRYNTYFLKTARIGTATSGSLNFSLYDHIILTLDANASLTLSNINIGETKTILCYNSHAVNTIGITLPTSIGDPSPAYIPAQKYVRFTIFNDGTNYVITYSGVLD